MICVIDDDDSVRASVDSLLRSIGLDVTSYRSPLDYISASPSLNPHCLVLDVRMPGMSGLDFQRRLKDSGEEVPIVFLSGHADVASAVTAMKAGAVEFLTKPFREQDLLDAISHALDRERQRRADVAGRVALNDAYERLTSRERQVMRLVVTGQMNKQIAAVLELSEVTVKMHRGRVMRKMAALSVADLVRMGDKLQINAPLPRRAATPAMAMRREA